MSSSSTCHHHQHHDIVINRTSTSTRNRIPRATRWTSCLPSASNRHSRGGPLSPRRPVQHRSPRFPQPPIRINREEEEEEADDDDLRFLVVRLGFIAGMQKRSKSKEAMIMITVTMIIMLLLLLLLLLVMMMMMWQDSFFILRFSSLFHQE